MINFEYGNNFDRSRIPNTKKVEMSNNKDHFPNIQIEKSTRSILKNESLSKQDTEIHTDDDNNSEEKQEIQSKNDHVHINIREPEKNNFESEPLPLPNKLRSNRKSSLNMLFSPYDNYSNSLYENSLHDDEKSAKTDYEMHNISRGLSLSNKYPSTQERSKKEQKDREKKKRNLSMSQLIYDNRKEGNNVNENMQNQTKDNDGDIEKKLKKLLQEWHQFCERRTIVHGKSQNHYKFWGNLLSIFSILLSTVGGASNIGTSGNNLENDKITPIVFGALSLVSGTLMTIHRYFNFNQLERDHGFYSSEYAKIKNDIHMQLYIHQCSNKTYVNLVEFVKTIKGSIDSMTDRAPGVPSLIINKFEKNEKKYKSDMRFFPSLMVMDNSNL